MAALSGGAVWWLIQAIMSDDGCLLSGVHCLIAELSDHGCIWCTDYCLEFVFFNFGLEKTPKCE